MAGEGSLNDAKQRLAAVETEVGALSQEVVVTDLLAIYILAKG